MEEIESGLVELQQARKFAAEIRGMLTSSTYAIAGGVSDELTRLAKSLLRTEHAFSDQQHERSQLRALVGVGQLINSSLDLTTVLNEVMDSIISLTGAERGFLMLRDNSGELEFRTARNLERESLNDTQFEISRTVVTGVVGSGEAVLTDKRLGRPNLQRSAQRDAL